MNFIKIADLPELDDITVEGIKDYKKHCVDKVNKNFTHYYKYMNKNLLLMDFEALKVEAMSMFHNLYQKRIILNDELVFINDQHYAVATLNMPDFVVPDPDGEGMTFNMARMVECQKRAVRYAMRTSLQHIGNKTYDAFNKRDRNLCISLIGWSKAFSQCEFTIDEEKQVCNILASYAHAEAQEYAHMLRIPAPLVVTGMYEDNTAMVITGETYGGMKDVMQLLYIDGLDTITDYERTEACDAETGRKSTEE